MQHQITDALHQKLKKQIIDLIYQGEFQLAHELLGDLDIDGIYKLIEEEASKHEHITFYGFFVYLLSLFPTDDKIHYNAAALLGFNLCSLGGAYDLAAYHTKQAMKYNPNEPQYPKYLGFLNSCPDRNR